MNQIVTRFLQRARTDWGQPNETAIITRHTSFAAKSAHTRNLHTLFRIVMSLDIVVDRLLSRVLCVQESQIVTCPDTRNRCLTWAQRLRTREFAPVDMALPGSQSTRCALLLLSIANLVSATPPVLFSPNSYVAYKLRNDQRIVIDGKIDDEAW